MIRGLKGVWLEIGGVEDHVHVLTKVHPTISISKFLEKLKANSSEWAKSVKRGFGWQAGYAAFTVRESQVDRVTAYIRNQREHHRRSSFREEVLDAHGLPYDPDSLWM